MCSTMGKDEGATAKRMWIARRDRVAGAAGVRGQDHLGREGSSRRRQRSSGRRLEKIECVAENQSVEEWGDSVKQL
jgi:hypothetical protein